MWLISLLFLPLSSALFTIPYGIQYDSVTELNLNSGQCSLCYSASYHLRTSSDNVLSCAGPVLFVGAQTVSLSGRWWDSTIYLGAFGLASDVHKSTVLNTPHLSNGAYWYFTPGKSFGFLSDTDLQQNTTADTGTTNPDSRLSWNLDNSHGGFRAGSNTDLYDQNIYRKLIYNCPNSFEA